MNKRNYLLINYIFIVTIFAIFIYSGLYGDGQNNNPVNCIHEELLGAKCPTCGLSRGFSAIVRFHFTEAVEFQRNSIPIFLFFAIELFMRLLSIALVCKSKVSLKTITNIDITLSLLLFIVTFHNLIFQSIYIFYKMLLTGNMG